MKYTAEQFPELVVCKLLQATEKKQIAIETWLKNANRGCHYHPRKVHPCSQVAVLKSTTAIFTFVRGKAAFPESQEMF